MQFVRSFVSRLRSTDPVSERMREDWDRRARENARYYIASDDWETEEQFEQSGESSVDYILSDIATEVPSDATVLEIGCGIGRMLKPLARRYGRVYGVDVSGEMIKLAKERTKASKNITVWVNNGRDLSRLPAEQLDLVISYITFQHVPSVEAIVSYIEESFRVLKPGGLFKFQVHGREDTPESDEEEAQADHTTWRGAQFTKREIVRITEAAGFRVTRSYADPIMYMWVIARKPTNGEVPNA